MATCLSAASARTLVQEFTSGAASYGSAVLNLPEGKIHLPFVVDRDEGLGGAAAGDIDEDDGVSIGRGTDGAFNSATYSSWDIHHGADPLSITLDTSHYYEFTTFTLDAGVTLRGSGNAPLKIRVQGAVSIHGTIDVSGADGSFSASASASGGAATCGGVAGGAGGDPASGSAPNGSSADGAVGGGNGGTSGNPANGGGGAGYATAGLTGFGGTAPGNTYSDAFAMDLLGGSGGGGGGGQNVGNIFGASGGGGGGVVFLQAGGKITISSSGSILADGGDAGDATGGAGDGGGGSGGAIVLFSGSTIENAGVLRALAGTGAGGTTGAGSGQGSEGRIRFVTGIGDITPIGTGSYQPGPLTSPFGQTYYTLQPSTVVSDVYDSLNTAPTYSQASTASIVPAGSSVTVLIAGSSDGFVHDNTGWLALTDLTPMQGKRYYRVAVTLQTALRTETPTVDSLTLQLVDREEPVFNFTLGSCAGIAGQPTNTSASSTPLTVTLMGLWLWLVLTLGRRVSKPKP